MNSRPPPFGSFPQPYSDPRSSYPGPASVPAGTGNTSHHSPTNHARRPDYPLQMSGHGVVSASAYPQPPVHQGQSAQPHSMPHYAAQPHASALGSQTTTYPYHTPSFPSASSHTHVSTATGAAYPPTIHQSRTAPIAIPGPSQHINSGGAAHHNPYYRDGHASRSQSYSEMTGTAAPYFADDRRHYEDLGDDHFVQGGSFASSSPGGFVRQSRIDHPTLGWTREGHQSSRRVQFAHTPLQMDTEQCRYCQNSTPGDVAARLNGFCSDQHMWDAINSGMAGLCPTCRRRACRPGYGFCSGTCGRG
ncbi:hypothetical protein BGW80DRAFT_120439 [Lactifluus volemus]|nr:hypothetical protein BGW80DRAFT_120439 [Lactifluus volemus]